jgi:hypothetical protein
MVVTMRTTSTGSTRYTSIEYTVAVVMHDIDCDNDKEILTSVELAERRLERLCLLAVTYACHLQFIVSILGCFNHLLAEYTCIPGPGAN